MSELITFPCDYLLKIVAVPDDEFPREIIALADVYGSLCKHHLNHSRRGNYASLSLTVHFENEAALGQLYQAIKSKPYVRLIF